MNSKVLKVIMCITVAFLFAFIGIGYAQITDILDVQGTADIRPQQGVFITNVSSADGFSGNRYIGSILNSTADLSGKSEITVNVTVYNNSNTIYGFNVMKYVIGDDTYDNENIVITTAMEKKSKNWVVEPNGYLTFPITYSFAKGASTSNPILNSVVEYEFLPFDEIPDNEDQTTVANAMERFKEILNTPDEKALLDGYMDNPPNNDRNTTYISNVPGANNTDIASIEGLFSGNLHININGEQTDVKIMIKEENVNNNYSGNEMVIYMTTDPLTSFFGKAIVYRCIFANNNGEWIQVGEMQTGTANVCDYSTGSRFGTGSFNTDSWKAG